MKSCSSKRSLAALPLALSLTLPVFVAATGHAQSTTPDATPATEEALLLAQLNPVVVTATRTAQALTDVIADVSLIDRETLERSGALALADLLARLPGVEFSRNGGPAATTGLFLRGTETRHTLLLIDGVRVDSQSTGGAAWNALPLAQIDHIELLRGPAAAIYGSDAIGGVIQVFTRQGSGPLQPSVTLGVGSYRTGTLNASLSGAQDGWDYALGLGREVSAGFNAQPKANPDRDGYRTSSGSARLGRQLNPDHRIEATWLASSSNTGYDGYTPNLDDRSLQDLKALSLSWQARWSEVWRSRLAVTQGSDRYETTPDPYLTKTTIRSGLWHNEWRIGNHQLTAALERREDRLRNDSTNPTTTERSQNALALGYAVQLGVHALQLNLRRDDDSEFGSRNTGNLGYALALSPQWRATASAGTTFRAPTLFQRFSRYGVPNLQPEQGKNLELGLKYAAQGDQFSVLTYRNRLTNLINYLAGPGSCANGSGTYAGCYGNTGKASYSGLTLAAASQLGSVGLSASLDLQDPQDDRTGLRLARRANRLGKLGADTTLAGWNLNADWLLSGNRFDDAANTRRLPGYTVVNLSASKSLAPGLSLLLRLDNLGDKDYQTAYGFASAGRSIYVALKWSGL